MYHEGQLYRGDGKRGSRYKYQVESHICIKFNEKETGIDLICLVHGLEMVPPQKDVFI